MTDEPHDATGEGAGNKWPMDDGAGRDEPKRIKAEPNTMIKAEPNASSSAGSGGGGSGAAAARDANGDYFFELSAKRRVTVRKYRDAVLVDIREVSQRSWRFAMKDASFRLMC